jgi:AraC family transcriptional regulator
MPENEPGRADPMELLHWLEIHPFEPVASPAFELNQPALTHHMLVLFARPPEELDVRYEGVLRHVLAPRRPERGPDGPLPRGRLRAVFEYIEEHLDASPSLEQLAAVARVSPFHFARQFKRATGLPPHQYVIARRVERARQLLQTGSDFSLAEGALRAGFSDQSQFSHHFKRLIGVTPGQFRMSARIE